MINASEAFKRQMINYRKFKNYADMTLADGTRLSITPADFMMGGCTITEATTSGNSFEVGAVVGKTATIQLANHTDKFSAYDFYGAEVWLYVGLGLPDGTTEKIRKGKFYVLEPETPGDVITVSMVDDIYKLDRPYTASTVYPASPYRILADCCIDCGIPIGFDSIPDYAKVIARPEQATYRNVVSYVCQMIGHNAKIDHNGSLQLVWYDFNRQGEGDTDGGIFDAESPYQSGDVVDGGNFLDYSSGDTVDGGSFLSDRIVFKANKGLKISTDDVVISGVKIVNGDTTYLYGTEEYPIIIKDNPMVAGIQKSVGDYLGARLAGLRFRPFTVQALCNPLYEAHDTCLVVDRKGNTFTSLINHLQFKTGAYTTVSCRADNPVKNSAVYFSPAASAVAQSRKNTESAISEYDRAVQNMNSLAVNAMGFFTTYEDQEDGSRIMYMHNKQGLSESTAIYKMAADGFFLSEDGGQSYTSGFDSEGNAVLNILYAVGIVADWIRGGTFTAGGVNNERGSIDVLSSTGQRMMNINSDCITFYGYGSGVAYRITQFAIGSSSQRCSVYADSLDSQYGLTTGASYVRPNESKLSGRVSVGTLIAEGSVSASSLSVTGAISSGSTISAQRFSIGSTVLDSTSLSFGTSLRLGMSMGLTIGSYTRIQSTESQLYSLDLVSSLDVGGSATVGSNLTVSGYLTVSGTCRLNGSVGFFGSIGSGKRPVSAIYSTSTATAATNATKINEIINALKAYGLI